ncbi:MAG: phosphotransferase [Actinomycetes bacterium]
MTHGDDVAAALSPQADAECLRAFLVAQVPSEVRRALSSVLPAHLAAAASLRLLRTKVKPGRRVTAYYDVGLDSEAPRRVAVRWSADSEPSPSARRPCEVEAEARRRALLEPFTRLDHLSANGRMRLLVAPSDPGFPQLPRLYDPTEWATLSDRRHGPGRRRRRPSPAAGVRTVRYRPGQRHVLRVALRDGRDLYAKVYRDDAGPRSLRAAHVVARALRRSDVPVRVVRPHSYLPKERAVLWEAHPGTQLSTTIGGEPRLARLAGQGLAALHLGDVSGSGLPPAPDLVGEARAVARAAEHVRALLPGTGRTLMGLLDAVVRATQGSTQQLGLVHGDYKCDNLLAGDGSLRVVDLDRVAVGTPAQDVGKMCSDLRWWAAAHAGGVRETRQADDLVEGFLDASRCTGTTALRRVLAYEVLFLLKAAARRVPVEAPDWAEAVQGWVDVASRRWSRGTP